MSKRPIPTEKTIEKTVVALARWYREHGKNVKEIAVAPEALERCRAMCETRVDFRVKGGDVFYDEFRLYAARP